MQIIYTRGVLVWETYNSEIFQGTSHFPLKFIIIALYGNNYYYYYLSDLSKDRVSAKGIACTRVLPVTQI